MSQLLGLESTDEDDLYEALDWRLVRQANIENELAKKHLEEGALVLYDVSSTYFVREAEAVGHKENPVLWLTMAIVETKREESYKLFLVYFVIEKDVR
ncbi:MAG: hypothetical protein F6J98_34925 [Moorea sp. SIO4G2]|nr:hypothetical protein [Moorena sp. SIO4G2]